MGQSPLPGSEASSSQRQANSETTEAEYAFHWFGVTLRLSKYTPNWASAKRPGLPCLLGMGSMRSIGHASGSASPVGQALPRMRVLPSAVFSTRSLRRYQVSGFQANGADAARVDFRLPGIHLQPLIVAEGDQRIALRDDAGVAHLPPLFVDADVGFDRVVRPVRRAHEDAHALEQRVVGTLFQHLLAVEFDSPGTCRRWR